MPRNVRDSARPRCSGAASCTARPAATGVNTAPAPISTRPAISTASEGAAALSSVPPANSPSASRITAARRQCAVSASSSGASTALASAYTVIVWPAALTLTPSPSATGPRYPVIPNAPVPMTKLHAANSHSHPGSGAAAAASGPVGRDPPGAGGVGDAGADMGRHGTGLRGWTRTRGRRRGREARSRGGQVPAWRGSRALSMLWREAGLRQNREDTRAGPLPTTAEETTR